MAEIKQPIIDGNVHRRILTFLNAAQRPQDLARLPGKIHLAEEHRRRGPDAHEQVVETTRRSPIDTKLARKLLAVRDQERPYGFTHIDQIRELLGGQFDRVFDVMSAHFSSATFGEWRDSVEITKDGNVVAVAHAALLCTGSVIFIEAACSDPELKSETPIFNPETGNVSFPTPPKVGTLYENLYCAGHCFLSDGKLLAVGGGGENGDTPVPDLAWIFDPDSGTWDYTRDKGNPDNNTNRTRMRYGRWYPTVVMMGDQPGRVLIASGWPSATSSKMEFYSEASGRFTEIATQDPPGDKDFGQLYPGLHLLPGGEVFYAPTGWGSGTIEPSAYIDFYGTTPPAWQDIGSTDRGKGMSVQILSRDYPFVRVMVVGGDTTGKNTSYQIINLSTLSPTWQPDTNLPKLPAEPSITPRTNVNVVLLPNNNVFVCGGTSANKPCWLYDPSGAGSWLPMANLPTARAYHSFALLLPSAEVLVGGEMGGVPSGDLEIFAPPYLFLPDGTRIADADRPTIDSVTEYPNVIHHGQQFDIGVADSSLIDKVVMVRPMAVTHQTDTEQRVIELVKDVVNATTIRATAPDGWHPHAMAPAGCYMLFIIATSGVPSKAKFIRLH